MFVIMRKGTTCRMLWVSCVGGVTLNPTLLERDGIAVHRATSRYCL
jgi:hypothetical protein